MKIEIFLYILRNPAQCMKHKLVSLACVNLVKGMVKGLAFSAAVILANSPDDLDGIHLMGACTIGNDSDLANVQQRIAHVSSLEERLGLPFQGGSSPESFSDFVPVVSLAADNFLGTNRPGIPDASMGKGVPLGGGYVLTVAHVLPERAIMVYQPSEFKIMDYDGVVFAADNGNMQLVLPGIKNLPSDSPYRLGYEYRFFAAEAAVNHRGDIALLYFPKLGSKDFNSNVPLKLSHQVGKGERVAMYEAAQGTSEAVGEVKKASAFSIKTSVVTEEGQSGSALWGEDGSLLGVLSGGNQFNRSSFFRSGMKALFTSEKAKLYDCLSSYVREK